VRPRCLQIRLQVAFQCALSSIRKSRFSRDFRKLPGLDSNQQPSG
jgi:hypothetical protein